MQVTNHFQQFVFKFDGGGTVYYSSAIDVCVSQSCVREDTEGYVWWMSTTCLDFRICDNVCEAIVSKVIVCGNAL